MLNYLEAIVHILGQKMLRKTIESLLKRGDYLLVFYVVEKLKHLCV